MPHVEVTESNLSADEPCVLSDGMKGSPTDPSDDQPHAPSQSLRHHIRRSGTVQPPLPELMALSDVTLSGDSHETVLQNGSPLDHEKECVSGLVNGGTGGKEEGKVAGENDTHKGMNGHDHPPYPSVKNWTLGGDSDVGNVRNGAPRQYLRFPFNHSLLESPRRKFSSDTPFVFPEPRSVMFRSAEKGSSGRGGEEGGAGCVHPGRVNTPARQASRPTFECEWSVLMEDNESLEAEGEGDLDLDEADSERQQEVERISRALGNMSPFVRQHLLHVENRIFEMFGDKEKQTININKFLAGLTATGMRPSDPRLRETRQKVKRIQEKSSNIDPRELEIDYETFMGVISENLEVLVKAFSSSFIIPDFRGFCQHLKSIYRSCLANNCGKVGSYIPQLAWSNPKHWAMSVCTVDGQRYSLGDVTVPFTLQSCSYVLTYAMVLGLMGAEEVHSRVGMEPSGRNYKELCLDYNNKPHNPMINAGAIMTASLLKPELSSADRFDFVFNMYKRLAGDEFLGFNNAVFLSEKECADRNFALAYFMRENKCFPEGTRLHETLDFYFQLCSLEITAESGAVMAATMANGGVNPLTGDPVLTVDAVRNTLTLMHSCGMYNYSGQFAFKVGLPSKSGVSGCILLVVPNTMGICLWSPPLDTNGNSCRGVQFCMELVSQFNFHNFDNLRGHFTTKIDPRTAKAESTAQLLFDLLFSAAAGDLSALRRHSLSGTDMEAQDYDGRTALHVASSEGHVEIVEYLLKNCQVHPLPKDRWNRTPLDDASSFNRPECAKLIIESCKKRGIEAAPGSFSQSVGINQNLTVGGATHQSVIND